MKILKPGNKARSLKFVCSDCGCKYRADEKEYTITDIAIYRDGTIVKTYECACPYCNWPQRKQVYQ